MFLVTNENMGLCLSMMDFASNANATVTRGTILSKLEVSNFRDPIRSYLQDCNFF